MRRRIPYKRIRIESVTRSELIKDNEDRWQFLTPDGEYISRIWIMGIVTDIYKGENNYFGLKVDDGSGEVIIKSWEGGLIDIQQWEKIEVLGQIQVSEHDEELDVYIAPEIITKITDDNWFLYHRLKVHQNRFQIISGVQVKTAKVGGVDLGVASLTDLKQKLKAIVKELDSGKGVTLEEITARFSSVDEAQIFDAITELLESGEFFEPKVGIYSAAFDS